MAARQIRRASPWRKWAEWLLTGLFLLAAAYAAARREKVDTIAFQGVPVVVDGDSLRFGTERVRLLGIDAPELKQTCKRETGVYACGREARLELARYAQSGSFSCEGWRRDRYGRLLVTCKSGSKDVNSLLVESGWAVSYGQYGQEEEEARARKTGLWAGEFDRPQDWRAIHGEALADASRWDHDRLMVLWNWTRQILFDAKAPGAP